MMGLALFLLMEGLWIGAIAVLADGLLAPGGARLGAAAVVLAYPVALVVAHPLARLRRAIWWLAAQGAAWAVFAALLVPLLLPGLPVPPASPDAFWQWLTTERDAQRAVALGAVSLFAWTRGAMLAGRRVDGEAVALGFQIGLLALMAVQGWAWAAGLALPGALWLNLGFVSAALMSLWHTRAGGAGGRRTAGAAVAGLALVLALGGLVVLVFSPAVLAAALDLLRAGWEAVRMALAALFALLPEPDLEPPQWPEPPPQAAPGPARQAEPLFEPVAWIRTVFTTLALGALALMLAVALLMNLRVLLAWLRRRLDETPGIAHDRSPRSLLDTLREVLRHLAGAARDGLRRLLRWFTPRGRTVRAAERRHYRRLLRRMEAQGWARHRHETPAEYARRMQGAPWPGTGGDLVIFSQVYSASRYGDVSPPKGRLRRLWKKTRRSLGKVPFKP